MKHSLKILSDVVDLELFLVMIWLGIRLTYLTIFAGLNFRD